jgi:hypothetical protein
MKKMIAALLTLALVFAVAMTALAEEPATWKFMNGIEFNMDMDQVMQLMNLPNPEIDRERTRSAVEFWELEYDHVNGGDGINGDMKFCFVDNSLVAIHYDLEEGTNYEAIKDILVKTYGDAVPFDAANIGSARYVIDDDGDLKDCKEMIVRDDLIVVLEQDHEGDMDVTILDPTAAYINN